MCNKCIKSLEDYNREQNIEIRKINPNRQGKCRMCESTVSPDTLVARIKVDGIKHASITLCLKCLRYINTLIDNIEE